MQHFFKPVNASLQDTSCDCAHYFNPTLQKMPMQYIWDPEFDVIAAAIAKDARAAAAVEEVAAADEPAKLPQEKNNNRNGALNWGIPENQSMMEIISEGGQYTYIKSNPIWEIIAVQSFYDRI